MSPCEQASVWREGQSKVNWARVKRKVSSQKKQSKELREDGDMLHGPEDGGLQGHSKGCDHGSQEMTPDRLYSKHDIFVPHQVFLPRKGCFQSETLYRLLPTEAWG